MPFINDTVFDNGLTVIDTATENLYICSQEPTTFSEASATYKLGTKATPDISAPQNGATDGRRVVVSAISDGTINTTGTATHWALTDDSASVLLATGALSASQAVTSGNTFTLGAFSITIRDAA